MRSAVLFVAIKPRVAPGATIMPALQAFWDGAGERFEDAGDGATLSDPATEKPNVGATAGSPSQGVRGS